MDGHSKWAATAFFLSMGRFDCLSSTWRLSICSYQFGLFVFCFCFVLFFCFSSCLCFVPFRVYCLCLLFEELSGVWCIRLVGLSADFRSKITPGWSCVVSSALLIDFPSCYFLIFVLLRSCISVSTVILTRQFVPWVLDTLFIICSAILQCLFNVF